MCCFSAPGLSDAALEDAKLALREKNYVQARQLFSVAAERGDDVAQYQLASLYRSGKGGKQSYLRAFRLFSASAEQGNINAMYQLAVLYEKGLGTAPDSVLAKQWLISAANAGHLLAGKKLRLPQSSSGGATEVLAAINNGDDRQVQQLIKAGAPLLSNEGMPPGVCQLLVEHGKYALLADLLSKGCKADALNNRGEALIVSSVQRGDIRTAALLIKHGASPATLSTRGDSLLHLATMRDDAAMVAMLLDNGANYAALDARGRSVQNIVKSLDKRSVAEVLTSRGLFQHENAASLEPAFHDHDVLHSAAQRGHVSYIETLIAQGDDLNAVSDQGLSALAIALSQGQHEVVELLLQNDVDLTAPAGFASLYEWVAARNTQSTVEMMAVLKAHKVPHSIDELFDVYTYLLRERNFAAADHYLGYVADGIIYSQQMQLLRKAAEYGHVRFLSFFPGLYSDEALRIAVENNQASLADKLLQRDRPAVAQTSSAGLPLLSEAITHKNLYMVQRLLQRGALPEQRSRNAKTALMYAAESGNRDIVMTVLAAGANVDAVSATGNTALMLAATRGHALIVEVLLKHGADPLRRNANGKSAADLALAAGYTSLSARLE
jgi:ankyrin repeat protein